MAINLKRSDAAVNAEADAVCALLNTGYIRIYTGSQPATADDAIGAVTLLAELRFGATAFGSATAGVATANAITADSSANASGTAAWARFLKSDGITAIWDETVGTSGSGINMNSVAISAGAEVSVTSYTYTANKG